MRSPFLPSLLAERCCPRGPLQRLLHGLHGLLQRLLQRWPSVPKRGQHLAVCAMVGLLLGGGGLAARAEPSAAARDIEGQFRRGEPGAALLRLDQALVARPGDAGLRFLQGVLLAESGRPAEAVAVFERMNEDFPDLPEPYNNLAVIEAAKGQLDRARGLLETALRLDPTYRTAHENLGDVFVRLAQRAYEAATNSPSVEPALKSKLRLLRELAANR